MVFFSQQVEDFYNLRQRDITFCLQIVFPGIGKSLIVYGHFKMILQPLYHFSQGGVAEQDVSVYPAIGFASQHRVYYSPACMPVKPKTLRRLEDAQGICRAAHHYFSGDDGYFQIARVSDQLCGEGGTEDGSDEAVRPDDEGMGR